MTEDRDRALLKRFEPILRFTRGEKFFPMSVATYVEECSLWMQRTGEEPVCLVPEGQLDLDVLSSPRAHGFKVAYFLKFIEPLNITELAAYRLQRGLGRKDPRDVFHAGRGRLARVGYASRFVDALFSISLLARGRVPGDTAAAAAINYQRLMAREGERYCYYGRVIRQNAWVILQYWFFYPFNDWRSGFFGVNDHEGDWEMVSLYLSGSDSGAVQPEWVAYAAHDFTGDDLRRRWDDPLLEKIGDHPVVYAAAGSHACYFRPGEYLAEVELPFLSPLKRVVISVQMGLRKLAEALLGEREPVAPPTTSDAFRVPFVDYARGDGRAIGPGQDLEWDSPGLLSPPPAWALNYRGMWGLYARDPIAGENAPAGPVYDRDGSVRQSWYDPLAWAGLNKVPPSEETLERVYHRQAEIRRQQAARDEEVRRKGDLLMDLGVEAAAMKGLPHLEEVYTAHLDRLRALEAEVDALRVEIAENEALLEALTYYENRLRDGSRPPVRAHLRRALEPDELVDLRLTVLAEMWSAISIGLMLIAFVAIFFFFQQYLVFALVALLSLIIFLEAGFRRRLSSLITSVTNGLALVCALILMFDFFWELVAIAVVLTGGYIMFENLAELWE